MIKRPLYTDKIMRYVDAPLVKILTGVRRSGKSTILKLIMEELKNKGINEERIIYFAFDTYEHSDLNNDEKLYEYLKTLLINEGKTYFFLDEIQEVKSWEKVVNSLMTTFDVDIYVTGSNSRMMASEISTYLTGRYKSFRIYPLSFSEYLEFKKEYSLPQDNYLELANYLRYGGFPAIHIAPYSFNEAYGIVKDIYNSTIYADIVKRNQIRKIDLLERIVRFIFENVGRTFSATSISKYLKSENRNIDNETVYNYLNNLESAYLIHRCLRYDLQGKEILKTQEKFYLCDSAMRYAIMGYSPDSVAAMLENIVFLELKRRGYDVSIGKINNTEIDFVASKEGEKIYIQVTQQISSLETEEREYGRLLEIDDNYPKYVLRTDPFADGNYKGIITMHIADFLLSDKY